MFSKLNFIILISKIIAIPKLTHDKKIPTAVDAQVVREETLLGARLFFHLVVSTILNFIGARLFFYPRCFDNQSCIREFLYLLSFYCEPSLLCQPHLCKHVLHEFSFSNQFLQKKSSTNFSNQFLQLIFLFIASCIALTVEFKLHKSLEDLMGASLEALHTEFRPVSDSGLIGFRLDALFGNM